MKQIGIFLLTAAILLWCAGCGAQESAGSSKEELSSSQSQTEASQELPNPVVTYDTLQEALDAVAFTPSLPESIPQDYQMTQVSVISGEILQIVYENGQDEMTFRAAGEEKGKDISGDYTVYEEELQEEWEGTTVTLKGEEDVYHLAVWQKDGVCYSWFSSAGFSKDQMKLLTGFSGKESSESSSAAASA